MGKHTKQDEKVIQEYENYVARHGIDEELINAYIEASNIILCGRQDRDYGLKVSARAKELIEKLVLQQTKGGTIWDLEKYQQDNKKLPFEFVSKYYEVMRYESEYLLDSYILYIEKNRPYKERFYQPRRKTLKQVVDKLQDLEDGKLDELFIHMPPRIGKLLADDTDVFTADGWKKHGNLQVGDMVVGSDGSFTKVTDIHSKHHTTHTIRFSDGTSVDCHYNHEWTVFDRFSNKYRTISTKNMIGNEKYEVKGKLRSRYFLPLSPIVDGEYKELTLHPYVLGAWLGDGTNRKPWITENAEDEAIINKIERCGFKVQKKYVHKGTNVPTYVFGEKLKKELNRFGMCYYGKTTEKHIPEIYLQADITQRLQLLAGLLDTDGCLIRKENRYQFSTVSERLKDDFVSLVRSFGWRTSVVEYEPILSSSGIQGKQKVYSIGFNPTEHIPCVLPKKQIYEFSERRRIAVEKIEKSEEKTGNCITVENADGIYLVTKNFIATHNSQIITLAISWHCAKDTEKSNLYVTYKEGLGGAFLTGVMEIWTDPTYCFSDVFPEIKVADTDAKNHKVDLKRKKKYKTLSGKGLESGLNGEYDAYGWLILDDILEGIQDVLNLEILKRKQTIFDNNVMSRKKEQCKLIHNGTIWSLHDLYSDRLEFLKNNPEAKNIKYDILKIPALNENDESNFDYDYGVGYTTQYYKTLRAKFEENDDMASWYAQYQQEPIERDGAVFNSSNMKFYNGVLPDEEPVKIVGACDVALGGKDYLAFPIAYVYEDGAVYIHDVVFDNSEKNITQPKVVKMIIDNNLGSAFFEANQGGEGYKDDIDRLLKENKEFNGGRGINLISKYAPTQKRKEQRIWDNAQTIREFYFRDTSCRNNEYRKFMQNVYSFTINGKNQFDDAPDSLSTLADFIYKSSGVRVARIMSSPI